MTLIKEQPKIVENDQITKLTEQEINNVSAILETYQQITSQLGQIKIQRFNLDQLEKQLEAEYFETQTKEKNQMEELEKKYGQGILDLNTKTFTKKQENS